MRWISFLLLQVLFFNTISAEESDISQATYSGKQNQDWEKIQAQLTEQKAKLDAQESLIKVLLTEKAGLSGDALSAKINQIKNEHQRLEKINLEYDKLNSDYHTKFPERGLKEKRVYTRPPVKSLSAIEEELSVQGRVKKVHRKVLSQYAKSRPKNKKESVPVSGDETNTKSVTDPIQYHK